MNLTLNDALKIMGLSTPYTEEELKKAYRKMAKEYHPDFHPGDKACEEKFKEINNANELLLMYLKDPIKAKNESERAAANKRNDDDAKRRQEEYQKRQEESKRRQEEAKRAYEEQRRREEAERQREYERMAREKAAREAQKKEEERRQKEEEAKRRFEYYKKIKLFKLFNISEQRYLNDINAKKELDSIYKLIITCYNDKEKRISAYRRKHGSSTIIPLDKTDRDKNKKVKEYEKMIDEQLGTIEQTAITVAKMYQEFFELGKLLGKTEFRYLEDYIFLDTVGKENIRKQAQSVLNKFTSMQSPFLNVVERTEMSELDRSKRSINYDEEIDLQLMIDNYIKENYQETKYSLYTTFNSDSNAQSILESFKQVETKSTPTSNNLHLFISCVINMANKISRKLPDEAYFKVNGDFKKVAELARNFDKLEKYYQLVRNPEFYTFKSIFERNKNNPLFAGKKLFDIYQIILQRHANVETINSFAYQVDIDGLLLLSDEDYKKLVDIAVKNSKKYEALVRTNPEYVIYQQIFEKYPDNFRNMTYEKAMDLIKAKCEYLKKQPFKISLIDDFNISEEKIQSRIKGIKKSKRIDFIIKHNPAYSRKKQYSTSYKFFDFADEPDMILSKMPEAEFEQVYMETYIKFVNKYHPEIRLTEEDYKKIPESQRDSLLEDIAFDQRLRKIVEDVNTYYKELNMNPVKYEDIRELDGKELDELEKKIMMCKFDSEFDAFSRKGTRH